MIDKNSFKRGDKVKVLIGCVWHNVEVDDLHESNEGYVCGTDVWATYFPFSQIRKVA